MDIEDRASKWADEYMNTGEFRHLDIRDVLIAAYLAGSSQAQRDYSEHYTE